MTSALAETRTADEVAAVISSHLREATGATQVKVASPDASLDAPPRYTFPLELNGRPFGSLSLIFQDGQSLEPDAVELVEVLAQQGVLALERVRLLTAEQTARQKAERAAERISRLQTVTASLAEVLSPESAAQVVIDQAVASMGARAGAVALLMEDGTAMELAASVNLSESVSQQLIHFSVGDPVLMAESVRLRQPLFLNSLDEASERSPWFAQMRTQGRSGSLACVPLVFGARTTGAISLAFEELRQFEADDQSFMVALARQCAQALERARLYAAERQARAEAETRERQTAFLAHVSTLLSNSIDYATTLTTIAQLSVEELSDWCLIDLVDEDGKAQRLSVMHRDPAKAALSEELCRDYPLDLKWADGIAKTLRTGESQLVPKVPDALIDAIARDVRHGQLLRALGYKSGMAVALSHRNDIIGAITFVRSTNERPYTPADLTLAQALAARAATAIDNARLYLQATEAIKARDSFISVASHELRTPLSTFKLGVDVLTRIVKMPAPQAALTERIPAVLDKVRGQSDRLERLVSQLMDVSRLSAGRLKLETESIALHDLVREAAGRFIDDAVAAGVDLRIDTSTPVNGTWDKLRLDQVLTNLISNALKYGRGTPVEVSLDLIGEHARIRVKDGGLGISPEDQKRIFDRFERVAADRKIAGLGLGLWIVREIVKAHGGVIHVHSEVGQGCVFEVLLPMQPPAA